MIELDVKEISLFDHLSTVFNDNEHVIWNHSPLISKVTLIDIRSLRGIKYPQQLRTFNNMTRQEIIREST